MIELAENGNENTSDNGNDKLITTQDVDRLYQTGMQFAHRLRLVGKHEEANEIEIWTLALKAQLVEELE
jgi:hypothetical protein